MEVIGDTGKGLVWWNGVDKSLITLFQGRVWETEMETTRMNNLLKDFCYRGEKKNEKVAEKKDEIKREYFNMRNTACFYDDGNKLIMKKRISLKFLGQSP